MVNARRVLLSVAVGLAVMSSAPAARGQDDEWMKLFNEGLTHYELNDFPQAIRAWEAGARLKPNRFEFQMNLGKAYRDLGRYRDAVAAFERAIALGIAADAEANILGDLGNLFRYLKTPRKAAVALARAEQLEPAAPRHSFALANAFMDDGRLEEAIAAYERCARLDPRYRGVAGRLVELRRSRDEALGSSRSSVAAAVSSSRARSAWLDLAGARSALGAGDPAEPAIRSESEEIDARAAYLDAVGAAITPGTLVLVSEAGAPARLKRATGRGLEVEGATEPVAWHALQKGVVLTLIAAADGSVKTAPLGGTLVLFDLGLWGLADKRIKAWVDAEPAATPRAFEVLARYRGLSGPPASGFIWSGAEWLTSEENDARTRDVVVVDDVSVSRADAAKLAEKQRAARRAASEGASETTDADRLRAEHGVTDVRTILSSGDPLKRADVVVVADGYTAAEMPKFERLADAVSRTLLTVEPFQSYARYVNVHRITVVAERSGIEGSRVRTSLGEGGLLTCNRELAAAYGRFAPDADLVIVCANVRQARPTGSPAVAGSPGFITMDASGEFNEVVLHELGHALAGLDDEYTDPALIGEYADYGAQEERLHLNTTRESNPKRAKWHYWLLPPALPESEQIGCFEGAFYRQREYFRPSRSCRMHTHSAKRYCAVCLEQLELSFYSRIEPVDDVNIREPDVFVWKDDATKLSAMTIAIAPSAQRLGGFTARWYVDDRAAPANAVKSSGVKTELNLKTLKLAEGAHEVVLRIDLRDARVRRDGGLLSSLRSWRVNVSSAPPPRIIAPKRVMATRGVPITFDISVEGGTPERFLDVYGPVGSVATVSADRSRKFVWCPPRSARGSYEVEIDLFHGHTMSRVKHVTQIVLQDPAHNVRPVFREGRLVLATRGKPLGIRFVAFDADGDDLFFSSANLPPGAELEAMTGILRWTPGWSTPFDGESEITVRVTDGLEEDELTFTLRVDNRPIEVAGAAFDVLMATRAPSADVRKAAFDALLASDLPRGGKLLELVRMLRDSEPEVVTRACAKLRTALRVSEASTRGLVALDLAEQTWSFVDRPEVLAFLKEFLRLPLPPQVQAATTRIQKDLTAVETYNRERGVQ